MKNMYLIIILVLTVSFLLIPLLATEQSKVEPTSSLSGTSNSGEKPSVTGNKLTELDEIKLYLCDKKTVLTLDKEEYVLGVVAAEMSAGNNIEALKAQALAAYTYAYRKHIQNSEINNEYDLTNDSTLDQGYLDLDARKAKWGDSFNEYEKKLKQAVAAVNNEIIVYNGEPILAAYHSISSGKTETAKNVWGTDYPYLQSENSVCDLLSPDFYSETIVPIEEFKIKINELGAELKENEETFIGESKKSSAGTVLSIVLYGKAMTGADIRKTFDLRSAAFDITFKNNTFIFTVSGYGHGVGMSQFGANYMAQQGSDYKEIIATYYRNCDIIKIK